MKARIERRLLPEIRRAFQFTATRVERYLVACHDSTDGGHFRPHRAPLGGAIVFSCSLAPRGDSGYHRTAVRHGPFPV